MTCWTVTMAKWLSYCRASGRIWVTRARVAVGLAMDYQTVPSISSAPLELLIEGVFDCHLPWKSAFHQRTAMWELRLRIQHYAPPCLMWQQSYVSWQLLLLLQIWQHVCHACIQTSCPSTRVCLELQINTDCPDFIYIWHCWLAFCGHSNNGSLVLDRASTAVGALPSRCTIYYVARLFTECLVKTLFLLLLLLTLQTFLKLCISLLPLFKLSERHHPSLPPTPPPPPHLYVRDRLKTRAHTKALTPANHEDSCMHFRILCRLGWHICRSSCWFSSHGPQIKAAQTDITVTAVDSWCSCSCWNTKYSLRATPCTAAAHLPPPSSPWKLDGFRLVLCTDTKSKGHPL